MRSLFVSMDMSCMPFVSGRAARLWRTSCFCLFGAPFETDAQLVVFEKDGYTDGSLTEDGDVYFYEGACNLYSGFNTRSTRKYRTIINRTRM